MKKLLVCIGTVAMAVSAQVNAASLSDASDAALIGASIVDFESGATGDFVTQSFGGLTISAVNSAYASPASFSVANDYSGSYNTRGQYHISNFGSEFQSLRFDFASSTTAFGFLFGASDSSWTLSAYGAGNTLLESRTIDATVGSNAGDFFGFKGLGGAQYATLVQSQDGPYATGGVDYVFVDNITVSSVSAVPEPESFAMLFAGLGVVSFISRRKKLKSNA